jgi:hypothetical protein
MTWLHEHGFIASYADYLALPYGVLEDTRLVMMAEAQDRARKEQKARHGR